jgi:hypothetical protein
VACDVTVIPDGGRDKWVPPPWHAPRQDDDGAGSARAGSERRATSRAAANARTADADRPIVLGFAIAPAGTGVAALLFAFVGPLSGSGSVPIGLLFLCVLQILGYVATRNGEVAILSKSWLIVLLATAGLVPLVSLQASLLREPYVSLGRHSATPSIISTLVVVLFILVVAGWCVVTLSSVSEVASLALAPLALLVPGLLGIHATVSQRTALQAIAEASVFAAGAMVLAWSLPRATRQVVAPLALAIQIAVLWAAGRGPSSPESSGGIVSLLYWVTVLVTAGVVVVLPLAATWLRRAIELVEEEERPRRRGTGEGERPK